MERGSDKHGPRLDEEMQRETESLERSGVQQHDEEWRQPEPPGDDQPEVTRTPAGENRGGTPPGLAPGEADMRTEMARHLEPSRFPTDKQGVLRSAASNNAPDQLLGMLGALPDDQRFETMQDVWTALGGGSERRDMG